MNTNLTKSFDSVNISSIIANGLTNERTTFSTFYKEDSLLKEILSLVSQLVDCPKRFYESLTEATKFCGEYRSTCPKIVFRDLEILRSLTYQLSHKDLDKFQTEIEEISESPEQFYHSLATSMSHFDNLSGDFVKNIFSDLEILRGIMFRLALLKNKSAA